MRSTRLSLLAAALLVAGCADSVAPTSSAAASTGAALGQPDATGHAATVTPRQELLVHLDHTMPLSCAKERVRFTGPVVYRLHETITPAGSRVLHVTVPANAAPGPFHAIGQGSGRIWTLERGASAQTIVSSKTGRRIVNVTRNETYLTPRREVMKLKHVMHLAIENGRIAGVNSESWSC